MGKASVGGETAVNTPWGAITLIPVSVGNPHAVLFVPDLESAPVGTLGPVLEKHEAFPGGVNVEFVSVRSPNRLGMRVWERGSGVTLACGTGACAAAAAAVCKGFCRPEDPIEVCLDGGKLEILVSSEYMITMTGDAQTVYEGETTIC